MRFDWGEACKSIIPIIVFSLGMALVYLIIGAMCWIEDCTGIPVPLMVVLLICVGIFVLSGFGVF